MAVLLVVVYHVWGDRVSGGVDVFFLLTGFLLTGQLVRAAETGRLRVTERWARTLVRLVPAMSLVLLVSAGAAMLLLPDIRWAQNAREVLASAVFAQNWQLQADAVDYAARNQGAGVVQHFWSLAVQGQFMLIWPLVVAGVALAVRRWGSPAQLRPAVLAVVVAMTAASFLASVQLTAAHQASAYFSTVARWWELGLGALLALVAHRVRLDPRHRVVLGWVGVVGLVACGLVITGASVFPGVAALWPTGCAVLVLVAGATGARGGADRWLGARPLQQLGALAFGIYLWHWPILVLLLATTRQARAGLLGGLAVIALALVCAAATRALIERPLAARHLRPAAAGRLSLAGVTAVVVVTIGWQADVDRRSDVGAAFAGATHPGAGARLLDDVPAAPVVPPPVAAPADWIEPREWDCRPLGRDTQDAVCVHGPEAPSRRIVVVGDSHAQQFSAALLDAGDRYGWQTTALVRSGCAFSTESEALPGDGPCLAWNEAVAAELVDLRPDLVVAMANRDIRVETDETIPPGFLAQWHRLDEAGIPVLAVRDNPRFSYSMLDCWQARQDSPAPDGVEQTLLLDDGFPARCGAPRQQLYAAVPPWLTVQDVPANVTFVDLSDLFCDEDFCPAEIGNVLVYLDDNHLTATYSRSLGPILERELAGAVG